MMRDIADLSGPAFNGRLTGTADDLESARAIAARFSALQLEPLSHDRKWLMSTETTVSLIAASPAPDFRLLPDEQAAAVQVGRDYLPILDSPSADVTAPVVFVGYGISDPAHGWDEYAAIDARHKIVIFLRGKPDGYSQTITHADKVRTALDKGASAFLTFTGPVIGAYEARRGLGHAPLAFYNQLEPGSSLPGAWIHTDLATRLFPGRSLSVIQKQLHALEQQSFETETRVHLAWKSIHDNGVLHNVLGLLPGHDPAFKDKIVVIGAHRDHFGSQAGLVFAGADDNASGTSVLLEIARIMATSGTQPKPSVLFVSFSGEEQGLLGSRYCVQQLQKLHTNILAMINIDHAGIGNGRLTVGVAGLEKSIAWLAGERAGLKENVDAYGFFPGGDHVPFKEAGIPTITVVSGGTHPHYHQTSDTPDTLSPEILERTAAYVLALIQHLTKESELVR